MKKPSTPRFEVSINGRKACLAGIPAYGVMNVILSRVSRNPKRFPGQPKVRYTKREWSREQLDVYVGGLEINGEDERNDRSLTWLKRRIKPGDKITVRILPGGPIDHPKYVSGRLKARPRRSAQKRQRR